MNKQRAFGRHVKSLRRARGLTQDQLAERSSLSADTIRRLEHGSFSPSLDTLRKLGRGLDLALSSLFESFELSELEGSREILDLVRCRGPKQLRFIARLLRVLFEGLDEDDEDDED